MFFINPGSASAIKNFKGGVGDDRGAAAGRDVGDGRAVRAHPHPQEASDAETT